MDASKIGQIAALDAAKTPGRLVMRGANLVDGDHPARAGTTVVVEGGRITEVGEDAAVRTRPDDRVVDLDGRSVMPGLVSCHFHTTFENVSPVSAPSLGLQSPPAYLALVAAKNAGIALDCGVTSIVCSSTPYAIDASLKQSIEEGWVHGPRMLCGGSELMSTGDLATGGSRNYYMKLGNYGMVRTTDGADGFQGLVRDEIKKGAEVVKLSMSQGHNAGPTVDRTALSDAELGAAVGAAHARGALIRAHAVSKEAVLACAHAGVDIIDHADLIDEECIEAIVEAGCAVVPSMFYSVRALEFFDKGLMDDWLPDPVPQMFYDVMTSMREDGEHLARMLPKMRDADVKIVMGDDFGTIYLHHGEYASELEFYVKEVGIAPLDVIRWATLRGAELLGLGEELGLVEVGRLADLLVVDGDPLVDIACLQDPAKRVAVIKGGVLAKDALPAAQSV
jgi:imidazolonepropionase-like amidohydrolase